MIVILLLPVQKKYVMNISISSNALATGLNAALFIERKLDEIIKQHGEARLLVATGSSQFEMLNALVKSSVDWPKVEVFHLDEYIGLPVSHPASFRKYLYERFIDLVNIKKFHPVAGDGDVKETIRTLTSGIREKQVDLALIGIGENAHIAFNDPPADFNTKESYIVVNLNEACKNQQVGEGWFANTGEVPDRAISMSPWQILQSKTIVSIVPHTVKARAIYRTFTSPLTNEVPATLLKQHPDWHLYLDVNSASEIINFS